MKRILYNLLVFTFLFFIAQISNAQVFWSENFGTGTCAGSQGTLATAFPGTTAGSGLSGANNGNWTMTSGTNGNTANTWYISSMEPGGFGASTCGDVCASGPYSNQTLHVGNVDVIIPATPPFFPTATLVVAADIGADYYIGDLAGAPFFFNINANTDKRIESPTIDCTGQSNLGLKFLYMENGEGSNDDATIEYSVNGGTTWLSLDNPAKTPTGSCAPQGEWTAYSFNLPATCDNNANVKIAFKWVNDNNGVGTAPSFAVDDITIEEITSPEVDFTVISGSESEENLWITVSVSIANPDAVNATVVDAVLFSGDPNNRLDTWATETVTFPAGSSADQTFDIFFNDDLICQEVEDIVFQLQNVSGGGGSATIGTDDEYTLTLADDEMIFRTSYTEDFETGAAAFALWQTTGTAGANWSASTVSPISGTTSLRYDASVLSVANPGLANTIIGSLYSSDCLNGVTTDWRMNIEYPVNPDADNVLAVGLTSFGVPGSEDGYGIAIGDQGGLDVIAIIRFDNGVPDVATPVFASLLAAGWPTAVAVGIEVTRDPSGNWGIAMDTDGNGAFDALTPLADIGIGTLGGFDATYITMGAMTFAIDHNSVANGDVRFDDISVNIHGCGETYYSQSSGNFEASIWDVVASGSASAAIPNQFSDFNVQSGHVVAQVVNTCISTLDVNSGGTYNFPTLSPISLGIHGDFYNFGTFYPGDLGAVFFGGHNLQAIDGTASTEIPFANLAIANDNVGILLGQDISVSTYVLPLIGVLDIDDSNLRLTSTATKTGSIYTLPEVSPGVFSSNVLSVTGTGEIIMERHVPADTGTDAYPGGWVGIGNPIQSQTVGDWNDFWTPGTDGLITTGFPGSDYPTYLYPDGITNFNNVIKYDNGSNSWVGATNLSNPLSSSDGYYVYMNEFSQDVTMKGNIFRGDLSNPLSFSGGNGWNLATNPYPCPLDWRLLYASNNTNLSPIMYVYDSDAGVYLTYNAVTMTGTGSPYIASSQSYFVEATGSGASLDFTEGVKSTAGVTPLFERTDDVVQEITLTIANEFSTDASVLGFMEEATNNYDQSLDGHKFNIPMPEASVMAISSLSQDGEDLGFNYYNTLTEETEIPVKINVSEEGEYTFGITNIESLPQSSCVMVLDLITNEMMAVTEDFSYTFSSEAFEGIRFHILLGAPIQIETGTISCNGMNDGSITVTEGEGTFNYTWYNENEEIIATGVNTIDNLEYGNYVVEVTSENGLCNTQTEVIELDQPQADEMNFLTTPANCSNNSLGELILDGQGVSGEYTYDITKEGNLIELGVVSGTLSRMLESGIYHVIITSNCQTFEYEANLIDPSAPQVDIITNEDNVLLIDGEATFSLTADVLNTNNLMWYVNEEVVGNEEDLNYEVQEEGIYTIKLVGVGTSMTCYDVVERIISVSNLVSVEELTETNTTLLLTSNEIEIQTNLEYDGIEVINALGQIVMNKDISQSEESIRFNISNLSNGAYIVKLLKNEETLYSGKFIK